MLDLISWVLTINENANLREQLDEANKRLTRRLARLPIEQRVAALQQENQELKIRLGVIIRLLAEKGLLNAQEIVETFDRFKTGSK